MDPSRQRIFGGCFCGAVRFEIELPTKWCAHCHCTMCRAAHGAAFVTWVGLEEGQFRITAGEDDLVDYASSETGRRSFCRRCGTTMLFRADRWPGEVHITRASIEGGIDREPSGHAYADRAVDWAHLGDDLPRFGGPSGTEPLE